MKIPSKCTELGEPISLCDFVWSEALDERAAFEVVAESGWPLFVRLAGEFVETSITRHGEGVPDASFDFEHVAKRHTARSAGDYYILPNNVRGALLLNCDDVGIKKLPNLPLCAGQYNRWVELSGTHSDSLFSADGYVWPEEPLWVNATNLYIFRYDAVCLAEMVRAPVARSRESEIERVVELTRTESRIWERGRSSVLAMHKEGLVELAINTPERLFNGGVMKGKKELIGLIHSYRKLSDGQTLDPSQGSKSAGNGLHELIEHIKIAASHSTNETGVDFEMLKAVLRESLAKTVKKWGIPST